MEPSIRWHTHKTLYVDIESGEQIRPENIKHYILIKTEKKTRINANKTIGHIWYIMQCKPNPQLTLKL